MLESVASSVSKVPTGETSPHTYISYYACQAYPSGVVNGNDYDIDNSYGSPDIRYTSFWWVDISGAPDSYLHNDVSYSYGSPVTTISEFTQIVYPNGILNNGSYGVDNSYGNLAR